MYLVRCCTKLEEMLRLVVRIFSFGGWMNVSDCFVHEFEKFTSLLAFEAVKISVVSILMVGPGGLDW